MGMDYVIAAFPGHRYDVISVRIVKLLELGPKQAKRMSNSESATSDTPTESDTGTGRRAEKKGGNRLLQVNGKEDSHSSYASSSDSDWSSFSSCSKRYNRSHGSKSPTPSPSTSPKSRSPIEMMNNSKTNRSPLSSPADS